MKPTDRSRSRSRSTFATVIAVALAWGACEAPNPDATSATGDQAESVQVALTTVPTGVLCVRITVSATTSIVKTFVVAAGATSANLQVGPLLPGSYLISADAFTVACTAIGTTVAPWIADQTNVAIRAGATAAITMTFRKNSPLAVNANFVGNVKSVAAGYASVSVVTDSGLLQAGSLNGSRTLVRPNYAAFNSTTVPGNAVVAVAPTEAGACAVRADGTIWCWGYNQLGELGPGIPIGTTATAPVQVTGLTNARLIAAGPVHVCASASLSSSPGDFVYCWGLNSEGQLGDGTTTNRSAPVRAGASGMDIYLSEVRALAVGYHATYAISPDGRLLAWGANFFGQLGDGTTTQSLLPKTIMGGQIAVAAGGLHACFLSVGGQVKCTGANYEGQLGDGTRTNRQTPVLVPGLSGVNQIVTGSEHTCAVTANTAYCWGQGYYGALGDGTGEDRITPTALAPLFGYVPFVSLAAGESATCGISAAFDVYCWGTVLGGIGDGTLNTAFSPVKLVLQ